MDIWENSILGRGNCKRECSEVGAAWRAPGTAGKPEHLQWPERGEHYWKARTEGHAEARWSRAVGHGKGLRLYRKPDRSHGSDMV